jgi:hypothetical protein
MKVININDKLNEEIVEYYIDWYFKRSRKIPNEKTIELFQDDGLHYIRLYILNKRMTIVDAFNKWERDISR